MVHAGFFLIVLIFVVVVELVIVEEVVVVVVVISDGIVAAEVFHKYFSHVVAMTISMTAIDIKDTSLQAAN